MPEPLTTTQAQTAAAIRELTAEKSYPPTIVELSCYLGIKKDACFRRVLTLRLKRWLSFANHRARSYVFVTDATIGSWHPIVRDPVRGDFAR